MNTGIYIFEPEIFKFIPENKFFDFSIDLFPLLIENKKKIYGYAMGEYWTDIGSVFYILGGKVKVYAGIRNKRDEYINLTQRLIKVLKSAVRVL